MMLKNEVDRTLRALIGDWEREEVANNDWKLSLKRIERLLPLVSFVQTRDETENFRRELKKIESISRKRLEDFNGHFTEPIAIVEGVDLTQI